jgi:hypothetical protein
MFNRHSAKINVEVAYNGGVSAASMTWRHQCWRKRRGGEAK